MTGEPTAWDRYWRFDRIASCMDGAGRSNYDERIAGPWREFFGGIDGGAVLDVCTGNGAVALIAAERPELEVTGVDLADIDPPHFVERFSGALSRINFIRKTNAAQLPFPDQTFGAVVSQYGIEYAPRPAAWTEAARVLKNGGRLRFVVHAADGHVAQETRAALEDVDFLLDDVALPERARECFAALDAVESADLPSDAERSRADAAFAVFNGAMARAAERIPRASDKAMILNAGMVLTDTHRKRRQVSLSALIAKADELEAEIVSHGGRQRQLLAAAMGKAELDEAVRVLAGSGISGIAVRPLEAEGRLLAYVIEGRGPA